MKLICEICRKEYSVSDCEYKADIDGGMTLMCAENCQYEDPNDLEIVGTTTEGTIFDESHGRGLLLWWMDDELHDLVTA